METRPTLTQTTADTRTDLPSKPTRTDRTAEADTRTADEAAGAPPVLRTKDDYDRRYHAKTGDTPHLPQGFTLAYLPERGWCQHRFDNEAKLFLIWAVSGDGRFWRDWARATAALLGCRTIVTICTRPIRPYIRLWHWQIDRTETKSGKHRFHCRTQDGRRVLITHKHTDPDGQDAYWVTEYLTERNDTHG